MRKGENAKGELLSLQGRNMNVVWWFRNENQGHLNLSSSLSLSVCFSLCCPSAPEVVARHRYGRPVDCWAVGVIMFIL